MVNENNIPKIETIYELKENNYEIKTSQLSPAARSKIIKMYGGNYVSERGEEGYGPCIVGDISNCRCSKEELERQKALVELQREKEKLESERKQRFEQRRLDAEEQRIKDEEEHREKLKKVERMKAAWNKWEEENKKYKQRWDNDEKRQEWEKANKAYLEEQESKMWWNRDINWRNGLPRPKPSDKLDDY